MAHTHSLQLKTTKESFDFMTGGNSTFTVVSKTTKSRYTFRLRKADHRTKKDDQKVNSPLFVQFLSGDSKYQFLGTIFKDANGNVTNYALGKKSRITSDSTLNKTFAWLFKVLKNDSESNFEKIEFWHEGRCGMCNRPLTDPVSILRGFGPICVPMTSIEKKIKEREATLAGLFELFKKAA